MTQSTGSRDPLLRLERITRSFPGVVALHGADLEIRGGEIHALVGENGAGKSTLVRILTGAIAPDSGTVRWDGAALRLSRPQQASRLGISVIHQEFNLIPALSIRENLFLGREREIAGRRARWIPGLLDEKEERSRARRVLERVGLTADPETPVRDLDVAGQQLSEIAKSLLSETRLLILDEPTAALSPREVDRLFTILRELRSAGCALLFISHRLEEVLALADRITVLRDGATVGTWRREELTIERMIEIMVGRPLDTGAARRKSAATGRSILRVDALRGGRVHDATFTLHEGEILGIAGLVGAGRTDLARLIAGIDRPAGGRILLEERPISFRSAREAIDAGVCLLTEDRKRQGLVLCLSALDNFVLPSLPLFTTHGILREAAIAQAFHERTRALRIRASGPGQAAGHLSGGNQQKLLVARWLERRSRILIFDEPTRGIDVGAKEEMYNIMRGLADEGRAILMISSELPEILRMSDRILVMREGRITGTLANGPSLTQQDVLRLAVA